ncbi:MAG: hypothetical protein NTX45_23405 [Proteobacteria bacterium]|nr:hypothetical protein [Pseudomonadota bacterium]
MKTLPLLEKIFLHLHGQSIQLGYDKFYFPAALVGMVLRNLHDIKPDRFTPLHIICRGIGGRPVGDSQWENNFAIWLPADTDDPDLLKDFCEIIESAENDDVLIWGSTNWKKPHILIARYVAAMVIGRAVSFGAREILLDYYADEAREKWGKIIDRAIRENGGPLMKIYSTALGCEPCVFQSLKVLKTFPVETKPTDKDKFETRIPDGKNIVGIDIGGSSVRIDKFVYKTESAAFFLHEVNEPIKSSDIKKYRETKIIIELLKNFIREEMNINDCDRARRIEFLDKFMEMMKSDRPSGLDGIIGLLKKSIADETNIKECDRKIYIEFLDKFKEKIKSIKPAGLVGIIELLKKSIKDELCAKKGDQKSIIESLDKFKEKLKNIKPLGAKEYIELLKELIHKQPNKCHQDDDSLNGNSIVDENTIAVGISLAAPVSERVGVPLAPSGPLNTHFGLSWDIVAFQPASFHSLDFTEIWPKKIVKVLNDGEADIKDSEQAKPSEYPEGVTVELKAGTGIAVAVHRDGEPWNVKAETAKAILNLIVNPQNKDCMQRFQQGVIGEYCSKKGLANLTQDIVFKNKDDYYKEFPDKHKGFLLQNEHYYENPGEFIGFILNDLIGFPDTHAPSDENKRSIFEEYKHIAEQHIEDNDFKEKAEFEGKLREFEKESHELMKLFLKSRRIYHLRQAVAYEGLIGDKRHKLLNRLQFGKKVQLKPTPKSLEWHYNKDMSKLQKFSLGCAWVLGRWLADAIALVVDIYGANEIRLAGGPLSQATGIFVTASVEQTLLDRYGFDLEVIWDDHQNSVGQLEPNPGSHHRIRSMKRLRLYYPPHTESSDVSGARGAAKAALEAWIIHVKRDQLAQCRDTVQNSTDCVFFTPEKVLTLAKLYDPVTRQKAVNDPKGQKVLITYDDVAEMLAKESAALGLTRTVKLEFMKIRNLTQSSFNAL